MISLAVMTSGMVIRDIRVETLTISDPSCGFLSYFVANIAAFAATGEQEAMVTAMKTTKKAILTISPKNSSFKTVRNPLPNSIGV